MNDWSPEFSAIAGMYGAPPIQFRWMQNNGVFYPLYDGILRVVLIWPFPQRTSACDVNVITHSHGGNVAIWRRTGCTGPSGI